MPLDEFGVAKAIMARQPQAVPSNVKKGKENSVLARVRAMEEAINECGGRADTARRTANSCKGPHMAVQATSTASTGHSPPRRRHVTQIIRHSSNNDKELGLKETSQDEIKSAESTSVTGTRVSSLIQSFQSGFSPITSTTNQTAKTHQPEKDIKTEQASKTSVRIVTAPIEKGRQEPRAEGRRTTLVGILKTSQTSKAVETSEDKPTSTIRETISREKSQSAKIMGALQRSKQRPPIPEEFRQGSISTGNVQQRATNLRNAETQTVEKMKPQSVVRPMPTVMKADKSTEPEKSSTIKAVIATTRRRSTVEITSTFKNPPDPQSSPKPIARVKPTPTSLIRQMISREKSVTINRSQSIHEALLKTPQNTSVPSEAIISQRRPRRNTVQVLEAMRANVVPSETTSNEGVPAFGPAHFEKPRRVVRPRTIKRHCDEKRERVERNREQDEYFGSSPYPSPESWA